jgi:hypothetical protein
MLLTGVASVSKIDGSILYREPGFTGSP